MTPLDAVLLAWSAVVASVSAAAVARSLRRPSPALVSRPAALTTPLLLVRPCAGAEPSLARTLGSLGALADDPAHRALVRLRFAVATADDAAVATIGTVCERLLAAGLDARLVVTGATALNQKSDQLARIIAAEPATAIVVNVDSDVDLSAFDWKALLSPFADPTIAAVWAPPHEARGSTLGDRASESLLGGSLHSFTLLAGLDPHGLVGKVVAMRRPALDAIGGFDALLEHLGEDMELARRWRSTGARVLPSEGVALARVSGRSPAAVAARYGRWLTVIRAQRPALLASYPALFFATPLLVLLTLVAVLVHRAGAVAIAATLVAVVARLAVSAAAARATGRSYASVPIDLLLGDALLAWAFARSVTTRTVRWRGRSLHVARGGRLTEAAP